MATVQSLKKSITSLTLPEVIDLTISIRERRRTNVSTPVARKAGGKVRNVADIFFSLSPEEQELIRKALGG